MIFARVARDLVSASVLFVFGLGAVAQADLCAPNGRVKVVRPNNQDYFVDFCSGVGTDEKCERVSLRYDAFRGVANGEIRSANHKSAATVGVGVAGGVGVGLLTVFTGGADIPVLLLIAAFGGIGGLSGSIVAPAFQGDAHALEKLLNTLPGQCERVTDNELQNIEARVRPNLARLDESKIIDQSAPKIVEAGPVDAGVVAGIPYDAPNGGTAPAR